MQDCANYSLTQLKEGMEVEKPYTLIDKRDGTEYTIALLKDGNIWMCENLRIGSNDKAVSFSSADTDCGVHIPYMISIPQGSTTGFSDDNTSYLYIDPTYGGYYSWKCATLSGWDNVFSILPTGWWLPTGEKGGDFQALADAYNNDSASMRATPVPGFVRPGYYVNSSLHNSDSEGHYWSSTAYNDTAEYTLYLDFSSIDPRALLSHRRGISIRGICRGNGS